MRVHFSLLPLLCLLLLSLSAGAEPLVRIAVAEGQTKVELQGERLRVRALEGEEGYLPVEGGSLSILQEGDSLRLPWGLAGSSVKVRGDGPIRSGDKLVRGSVEVLVQPGGLLVVNEVPMEAYLAAVLGSEMMPSFHPEALKTQAVASRTYTIQKMVAAGDRPYHLGATVLSQVYDGVHREDPRTHAAVEATKGEVLVHEHAAIEAYFFSSCGGATAEGGEALGRPLPYLQSVPCEEAPETPRARWTLELSAAELGKRLGLQRAPTALRVAERSPTGRALRVVASWSGGERPLNGAEFRRRLGYAELRSLAFEVERQGSGFFFRGRGNGHGAGMCQWGAEAAAKGGKGHAAILGHYYPGAELRQMY